ncbi:hypothetical protein CCS79_12455 [Clostridium diolis]|uniref:acyltransferase family protein n=1 Tax=Clostridium diolis TaxID=223919 RepID=UPI000B401E08|nr:acyltransferase family protein [Clostridium diolis]OVE67761.1 hypothetical protein CCS79_12455 [Clostridium diolis]
MEKFNKPIKVNYRNALIDFLKGIAIFFVLWGHSIQYCSIDSFDFFEDSMFKVIYSFHMPLFMLISGYLFYFSQEKKTFKSGIISRLLGLGIPIIIWNSIKYWLQVIINLLQGYEVNNLIKGYISSFTGYWFLWSVLVCSLIVICINKFFNKYICFLLILVMPFAFIFPNGGMNLFMYPYFLGGFLFCKYEYVISEKIKKLKYLCLIFFPLMLMFFEKKDYIYTSGINPFSSPYGICNQIVIDIYRWTIGFVGSIFIICIAEIIINKFNINRIIAALCSLGIKSLQVYLLQAILLEDFISKFAIKMLIKIFGFNILAQNMILYDYIISFSIALIYSVVLYYFIIEIERNKKISKILFGR